jgi:membrane protease YdiL (CAAX protease family)
MIWAAVKRPGFRYLGPALVIGFAPRLLQTLVLLLTGWGSWDAEHFELTPDGQSILAVHKVAMVLGTGPQSVPHFALNLLVSITLAAVVTAVVGGVGEEIGWRGFLQPALETRVGPTKATLLVGAIWAYWHLGANLSGYNDPQHPLLNALVLFPVAVVMMSFGFAWLARKGLSVWPVALAHGANNVLGSAFLLTTDNWWINASLEVGSMALLAGFFVWHSRGARSSDEANSLVAVQSSG